MAGTRDFYCAATINEGMGKCPYCGATLHLKDFFAKEPQGFAHVSFMCTQESIQSQDYGTAHMWVCPKCDKILGFSERANARNG